MQEKTKAEADITQVLDMDKKPDAFKGGKPWIIASLLILAMLAVGFFSMKSKPSVQYKTQEAVRGSLTVLVSATGTLQPTNKVDVGSELSGIIKSVPVDYNDRVKAGQPLAVLDTTKLEAQVTQSKSALQAARAKVQQTRATREETRDKLDQYERVLKLSDGKVPSRTELNAARAAYDRAKADEASAAAEVSQAQATLDGNLTDLSKAVIRSPINGVILTRSADPGQTVAASFQSPTLFSLAEDLTKMELHVNVDEADIGKVKVGQEASFRVSAYPNRTFTARIIKSYYGSSTTSGVVTYETVLRVDNADLSLRPGMTVTADIKVQELKDALLVPGAALRFTPAEQEGTQKKTSTGLVGSLLPHPPHPSNQEQGKNDKDQKQVWTLQNGQLKGIQVTVGASNGSLTEITGGGLRPGMAVVVDTVSTEK